MTLKLVELPSVQVFHHVLSVGWIGSVCIALAELIHWVITSLINLYDLQTLRTTLDAIYDAKVPPLWGKVSQMANKQEYVHAIVLT